MDLDGVRGDANCHPLRVDRSVFIRSALARENRLARIAENARSRVNPIPEYPLERGPRGGSGRRWIRMGSLHDLLHRLEVVRLHLQVGDLAVTLGGGHRFVSEQILDGSQVGSCV